MIRLGAADYRRMPWANGRGTTVEMLRIDAPDGSLLVRLSMASVVEDGPFSLFPGIERNLTVLSGPGFRLEGEGIALDCRPLVPVAFPGDVPVRAIGTGGVASEDFNVMTARGLARPRVGLLRDGKVGPGLVLALDVLQVGSEAMARHDLMVMAAPMVVTGPVFLVEGLPLDQIFRKG